MIFSQQELYGSVMENCEVFESMIHKGCTFDQISEKFIDLTLYAVMSIYIEKTKPVDVPDNAKQIALDFLDYVSNDLINNYNQNNQRENEIKLIYLTSSILKLIDWGIFSNPKDDKTWENVYNFCEKKANTIDSSAPESDIQNCLSTEPLLALSKVPAEERWRLYVDGDKQRAQNENGWQQYEIREPGCIKAMHLSFNHAITNLDNMITIDFIKQIHDLAIAKNVKTGWGGDQTGVSHYSVKGVYQKEFKDEYADTNTLFIVKRIRQGFCHVKKLDHIKEAYIQSKIDKYENEIKKDMPPKDKLTTIVSFISDLAKAHPFSDANCRTFSIILLNKELIRNGFSPCIMDDPNVLEGLITAEDGVKEVVNGMNNFHYLQNNNLLPNCDDDLATSRLRNKIGTEPDLDNFVQVEEKEARPNDGSEVLPQYSVRIFRLKPNTVQRTRASELF